MKIILDENFYIENEMWGFTLKDKRAVKTSISKKGVTYTNDIIIGSFGNLQQALTSYVRNYLNENITETDMKGYIAEYQKQVDRIIGMLPTIGEHT